MGRRRRNNLKVYVTRRRVNPITDISAIRRTSSYRLETSMTDVRRSSGDGGPFSSFRKILMTRSTKVRDICFISTKQKYQQQQVEPEVLKQNTTNQMKERVQYDMFRAKNMGGQQITTETNTSDRPAINDTSKTNRQCKVDSRREGHIKSNHNTEDKYGKHIVNNNTLFKQLNAKNQTDRNTQFHQTDSLVSLLSETKSAKLNIYETVPVPRHQRRTNETLHTQELDSRITADTKQDTKRKQKCIFSTHQTSDLIKRPQTPKIKKSVEIRNNVKLLHSNNAADVLRRNKQSENDKARTTQGKTRTNHAVKSSPGVKAKADKMKTRTELTPQLLHPLWRRVPHRTLYGWSEQHQRLENKLYKKMTEEPSLTSMYYPTEAVYKEEQTKCGPSVRFLARPIVSSVEEVLALLKYYETCPNLLPKTPTYEEVYKLDEDEEDSDVESGYDGDDE